MSVWFICKLLPLGTDINDKWSLNPHHRVCCLRMMTMTSKGMALGSSWIYRFAARSFFGNNFQLLFLCVKEKMDRTTIINSWCTAGLLLLLPPPKAKNMNNNLIQIPCYSRYYYLWYQLDQQTTLTTTIIAAIISQSTTGLVSFIWNGDNLK